MCVDDQEHRHYWSERLLLGYNSLAYDWQVGFMSCWGIYGGMGLHNAIADIVNTAGV
jgi:hypothetical protein